MARVHGKNAKYSFNAIALEGELNDIQQNMTVPESEITSFADVWQNFLAGDKKNIVTEISGSLDTVLGAGDATIFGAIGGGPVSTVFDLTGNGPGANDPEYQCSASGLNGALVANYKISLPVGDKASYSASVQHSGLTTRATS